MSELFMECEEEELEPWQKQVAEVNLLKDDDDDDEPIFVGELTNNQKNCKTTPVQNSIAGRQAQSFHPQPSRGFTQSAASNILAGKAGNIATCLTTITQQPIIVNNQGYIVTTPQLQNNSGFFTSLGKPYPPGTSFTIIPAGQQHILQQVTPAKSVPGVVHRPQVQQIHNNVVTLSNVQSPASFIQAPKQLQQNTSNSQPVQIVSTPVKIQDNIPIKRSLPQLQNEGSAKKAKSDKGSSDVIDLVEKRNFRKMCPKCRAEFFSQETMKSHMRSCCPNLTEYVLPSTPNVSPPNVTSLTVSKRIMLVKDFYYGKYEGEKEKQQDRKTGTTFKCQSCLKVLKNNVRFMNHMKHHLELEKQNCESWESHTTCQHCYRQYSTPFQLQCHIESAHSPFESTTNCKICELAFESEQVLLEHMKDNHKPGEMPYICLVCNYRSSFFSDVETHFRNVHQNTKDLLCPFCLKVLKSGYTFMQHYMKHQNKGIHRCGKCRLNFLTYKERVEHKAHFHKTFRKPKALEGLPPGTKVTIRASLSLQSPSSPNSHERSSVSFISETASLARKKSNSAKMKSSPMNTSMGKATSKKQERLAARNNQALRNLSIDGHYTCIECDTKIDDFFGHFPTIANCGACKYRTSCSISFGNHMIRFHSTISKDRFRRMENRKIPHVLKSLSLVCLNCDLLLDASECDRMSKHLTERPHHICKVLHEKEGFQTADKGVCASSIQQLKKAEEVDELRCELEESSKVSELCPKSTTEGLKNMIGTQSESLESGGVILLDSKTTAHYSANASEQEFPADTLNKELPNTTLPESSVMNNLTKEQSLLPQSTSPSLSLVCALNEVSGGGEQINTLLECATPLTSLEPELTEIVEIKESAVSI